MDREEVKESEWMYDESWEEFLNILSNTKKSEIHKNKYVEVFTNMLFERMKERNV